MTCRYCSPHTTVGVVIYRTHSSLQKILEHNPGYRDYRYVYVRSAERKLATMDDVQDIVVDHTIPEYEWATYAKLPALRLVDRTGAQICHVS